MPCACLGSPRSEILQFHAMKISDFGGGQEGLQLALDTADKIILQNRNMYEDAWNFGDYPDKIDKDNPLCSMFFYVHSKGRSRHVSYTKTEETQMKTDITNKRNIESIGDEAGLEMLAMVSKASRGTGGVVKEELPGFETMLASGTKLESIS